MSFAALFLLLVSIKTLEAFVPRGVGQTELKAPTWRGSSLELNDKALRRSRSRGIVDTSLYDSTLVEASYNLAAGSATLGLLCGVLEDRKGRLAKVWGAGAIIFTLFGGFVAYQTSTLRFKFDDDSFSLVKADGKGIGENLVVGGENSWQYSSFVNWGYFPSANFPVLVYFKETQTPADVRVDAPDIVVDDLEGQAHYFPAIARSDRLTELFEKYDCKRP